MSSDLPPHYSPHSHPQFNHLPLYTECPRATERRVQHSEPSSPVNIDPNFNHLLYKSDHFEVDLGQFPRTLTHAAYGFNGVVAGSINFTQKCTHVSQVTVKLEGFITTTASEYSTVAVTGMNKVSLFTMTVPLVSQPNGGDDGSTLSAGSRYPFSIPFPTYISGQTIPLPPSYVVIHPGVLTEVSYHVQVDVVRKGIFRRREVRRFPVLYLPKSRPPVATIHDLPRVYITDLPENVKATALTPTFSNAGQPQHLNPQDLPTIHLFVPVPRHFTSGDPIPVAISISCESSPALAKLYANSVSIQLIKKRKLWVSNGRQVSVRETQLSTAMASDRVECDNGEAYLSFRLEAGLAGRECSWAVDGALEVSYFIRVIVRPPQDVRRLPTFCVDEPIRLATDGADIYETAELTGEASLPAMGLTIMPNPERFTQTLARRNTLMEYTALR